MFHVWVSAFREPFVDGSNVYSGILCKRLCKESYVSCPGDRRFESDFAMIRVFSRVSPAWKAD